MVTYLQDIQFMFTHATDRRIFWANKTSILHQYVSGDATKGTGVKAVIVTQDDVKGIAVKSDGTYLCHISVILSVRGNHESGHCEWLIQFKNGLKRKITDAIEITNSFLDRVTF